MLLNLSNHPSANWPEEQRKAAIPYGEIIDLPFPVVDPFASESAIAELSSQYVEKIRSYGPPADVTIHLMGEFCFTYNLLHALRELGYTCVASTTTRKVMFEEGVKKVLFEFCLFRKYWTL